MTVPSSAACGKCYEEVETEAKGQGSMEGVRAASKKKSSLMKEESEGTTGKTLKNTGEQMVTILTK